VRDLIAEFVVCVRAESGYGICLKRIHERYQRDKEEQ
jgi:hypothetical protein